MGFDFFLFVLFFLIDFLQWKYLKILLSHYNFIPFSSAYLCLILKVLGAGESDKEKGEPTKSNENMGSLCETEVL